MEKKAAIKQAGAALKTAVEAVRDENQFNIQVAIYNRNVFFTGEGLRRAYKSSAFRNMIREADGLVGVALDDE